MPIKQIDQFRGRLSLEAQTFPTFGAVLAHDVTVEQITASAFWHPENRTLEAGARIRCEWEDGSKTALLRVMGIDPAAREVLVIVEEFAEFPVPELPPGFSMQFVNKAIGWRILEEGRKLPRRAGFATAYAAAHWLRGDRTTAKAEPDGITDGGDTQTQGGGNKSKGKVSKPAPADTAPV